MNNKHHIIRLAVAAVLPIVAVHGCFTPLWFTQADARSGSVWLPLATMVFTGLVAPIYLAVLGCRLVQRERFASLPLGFAVLLLVLALDFFLDYALWSIDSDQFRTPDEGTIRVFRLMAVVAATVFVVPPVVALIVRCVCLRSSRHA